MNLLQVGRARDASTVARTSADLTVADRVVTTGDVCRLAAGVISACVLETTAASTAGCR